jgi:hypothetical protein
MVPNACDGEERGLWHMSPLRVEISSLQTSFFWLMNSKALCVVMCRTLMGVFQVSK